MKRKLRKGDHVLVITGNDRGRTGKILSVAGNRVTVEGVNVRKKHMRKTQENQQGQIIDIECSVHISNVRPAVQEKPVKLRVRGKSAAERELYYLDGNKEVVYRSVKKQGK